MEDQHVDYANARHEYSFDFFGLPREVRDLVYRDTLIDEFIYARKVASKS